MSTKHFCNILMALVAMSCFKPSFSFAQASSPRKIQTPNTNKELVNDSSPASRNRVDDESVEETAPAPRKNQSADRGSYQSAAPRQLQQHGIGLGIGQTFLLGDYAKHGQDKITVDVLYTYAASYSFDLLLDFHLSEHEDNNESMELLGLSGSIKSRLFEFDNFSPFVLGGLGFYGPKAERDNEPDTSRKMTFGLNFGGGVDLRLNDEFVIGAMAQMHWPFKVQQEEGSDLKGYYGKLMLTGMYLY